MASPCFSLVFPNQAVYCAAQYEPENDWFRIVWSGFVINDDGVAGATAYLQALQQAPSSLLLNDNSGVTGPWFDSLDWLQHIWAPQVVALGLRYVAHVLPANDFPSVLPAPEAFSGQFELQIFSTVAEAEHWLHTCRDALPQGQVA
ncbi:hypothetical protein [Hymenobacter cellulosilyticus]|uniref:STAS/SEC14 domain-containing protein n=1 Tax=Hymenobacter cellulosilyticus TaxID=2932248 RepID=A0A8T9Q2D7_9BACT|nr:hypothetical protein [Hymenobacter cellulosilyticus]UOQ70631.1 hypothetical protein MUN79_18200 [Hymenobacter cellulosilyticus]